ncbi:hypothetical protein B0H10DRAFT_2215555 [Mycena sp. CBHHK59/15]|nr:hypothetical protein B0H10DRAFT_2215555 [Mycena sp. CBHHK59/15]
MLATQPLHEEGIVDALVRDASEFINAEDWYVDAGIPHHRRYLLYGPPVTGKSTGFASDYIVYSNTHRAPSTIYALAGALNLEIFILALARVRVRAASAIPNQARFLIEDIDCAFAPDDEDDDERGASGMIMQSRAEGMMKPLGSKMTLSGLLNVINGVGSEKGKLFFATADVDVPNIGFGNHFKHTSFGPERYGQPA